MIPNWICDFISSEPFYIVVGAMLAVGSGIVANMIYQNLETADRRKALLRILVKQIGIISIDARPFDPTMVQPRDPIHLSALGHLLSDQTLHTSRQSRLIEQLVEWQSFELAFNESVRILNQSIMSNWLHADLRQSLHEDFNDSTVALLRAKVKSLLDAIPLDSEDNDDLDHL